MELSLDILRNDAFSVTSLQRVVDNAPFVPTLLGQLGLFNDANSHPINTDTVVIYEEDGAVRIIPITERGAPDIMQSRDRGRMFAFKTVRLSKKDSVRGSELLGIANTALPEQIRLRRAADLIAKRTAQLRRDMQATKELHRRGAIFGKLVDADGTTVVRNFFTEFGITEPGFIDVNFGGISADEFQMFWQTNVVVPMMLVLKDRWVEGVTTIGALVGDNFWQRLLSHPAVRELWKLQQQGRVIANAANPLARPSNWQEIEIFGIRFINYRGSTGGEISVGTNEARFFPIGATDTFAVYWSPGETLASVQEEGKPDYLIVRPDVRADPEFVDITHRSYPLYANIFPKASLKARIAGT